MNSRTKKMICMLVAIASVLTIVGSVSYAYFTAIGEVRPIEATLNTAKVSVIFRDNDLGLNAELNFGDFVTKKFTIENTGTADSQVRMFFDEMTNTYIEGSLTYTLSYSETVDGTYTEVVEETNVPKSQYASKKILANSLTVPFGKKYYYELTISLNYLNDINQDADINAIFNTKFKVEDINSESKIEKIIASSQGVRSEFDDPATTDEGIFEMEDDYGTSYYFRGTADNNYVQFAGFYWRIIRVNGDGSLRIIYDGTQAYANGANETGRFISTGQKYNNNYNDVKYVGWMYGPNGTVASSSKEEAQTNTVDSDIKKVVDEWYKTNIVDAGFDAPVADTIFCNDRSTSETPKKWWTEESSTPGFATNNTAFGVTNRFLAQSDGWKSDVKPTFRCDQKNDRFTVDDISNGNGALTYPVGLITADEIVAAGSGKGGTTNDKYYLYRGNSYHTWSMSPHYYKDCAFVSLMDTNGQLSATGVHSSASAVAPVINLTYDYAGSLIGNGTMSDPYREA